MYHYFFQRVEVHPYGYAVRVVQNSGQIRYLDIANRLYRNFTVDKLAATIGIGKTTALVAFGKQQEFLTSTPLRF